jgi:hypothetical protein
MTLDEMQAEFPVGSKVRAFTGPTDDDHVLYWRDHVGNTEYEVKSHCLVYVASPPEGAAIVMDSVGRAWILAKKYIEHVSAEATGCTCSLADLMARGCTCGQMVKERV